MARSYTVGQRKTMMVRLLLLRERWKYSRLEWTRWEMGNGFLLEEEDSPFSISKCCSSVGPSIPWTMCMCTTTRLRNVNKNSSPPLSVCLSTASVNWPFVHLNKRYWKEEWSKWDGHLTESHPPPFPLVAWPLGHHGHHSAGDAVIRHLLFTRGLNNEQEMQQYPVVLLLVHQVQLKCFDRPTRISGNNARYIPRDQCRRGKETLPWPFICVRLLRVLPFLLLGLLLCRYLGNTVKVAIIHCKRR